MTQNKLSSVACFEKAFTAYLGCQYAIATSYGRTALYLALRAMEVEGKEVLVPAFICTSVKDAITAAGARIVYVDIDPQTLLFQLEDLEKKYTKQTKALIFVHFFGKAALNTPAILDFVKKKSLLTIEDCAHSLGAKLGSQRVGSFGDVAIFSLTKNASNYGGGVLSTNNEELYIKACSVLKTYPKASFIPALLDAYSRLVYGYKTAVDKGIFDRVGKNFGKWWIISIPDIFPGFFLKLLGKLKQRKSRFLSPSTPTQPNLPVQIFISRIAARKGLRMLQHIDAKNELRKAAVKTIQQLLPDFLETLPNHEGEHVFTNLILRFPGKNIQRIAELCKQQGLLLRRTWPAFQTSEQAQDTAAVQDLCDTTLLFNVSPKLNAKELKNMATIIQTAVIRAQ